MRYTTVLHTGNPAPFLYTTTSLLPEYSVLTDVQQATGRNGQQWITCKSGGEGTRPEIWMGSEKVVPSNSTNNSTTIGLTLQRPNGLYHCLRAQSQREYFSLFLSNAGKHQPYDSYQMSHCIASHHWDRCTAHLHRASFLPQNMRKLILCMNCTAIHI